MPSQQTTVLGPLEEPEVGNYFVSAYPPFSCWDDTGLEPFRQALGDRDLLSNTDSLGLYVHIPFCVQRCAYCYYLSHDGRLHEVDRYLSALTRELELYTRSPAFRGREFTFVYFGGGTPSLLSLPQLRRLLGELQAISPWDHTREVTFECAPRSVTEAKLGLLRDNGITRLSLGVQQLDDEVLRQNGRTHLVRDVRRAYERIRRTGFEVVNLDLIVGLVGETDDSLGRSLDEVVDLAPDSVTIYQLEIPLNTPLYRSLRDGGNGASPAGWDVKRARLAFAFERLEQAGYSVQSAYQAVRDPDRCRFVYQEDQYRGANLLGIGASSFSYLGGIHQQNEVALARYLDRLSAGELPLSRAYALDESEKLVREFVLQIKLGRVEAAPFRRRYGIDVAERFAAPLASFVRRGWLVLENDGVSVTRDGLLRVDRMIPEFYLPQHRVQRYS